MTNGEEGLHVNESQEYEKFPARVCAYMCVCSVYTLFMFNFLRSLRRILVSTCAFIVGGFYTI